MQRALIVYRVDKSILSNNGVVRKLSGQVEGLKHLGLDVDYVIQGKEGVHFNQTLIYNKSILTNGLLFKFRFWDYLMKTSFEKYDIVIVRYGLMVPSMKKWLERMRHDNPNAKIVLEMPTYPYEAEWSGWKGRVGLYFDRRNRIKLKTSVDAIIHSGAEKEIFGIPTIQIGNGINPNEIRLVAKNVRDAHSSLKMLAVGKWQYWHGLDRLIQGLSKFNLQQDAREIHLDIVGEGPVLSLIRTLVKESKLENLVTFHGSKVGSQLKKLMDCADIGIGTLGLHRKGVNIDSSLKHREYCASGLPFILSSPDIDFNAGLPFVLYFPINDTPIDIDKLISFNDRLDREHKIVAMVEHARTHLSWQHKMNFLLESL